MMTSQDFDRILEWIDAKETAHTKQYGFPIGDDDSYSLARAHVLACKNLARRAGVLTEAVAVELPAMPALKLAA